MKTKTTTMAALTWLVALLMFSLAPTALLAQEEEGEEEAAMEQEAQEEEQENPFEDFEKLVEDAEHLPGFFDLYTKEGKLYLAVPKDRLGEEFLMDYRVAQGIGASGLYGGTTISFFEMDLVALEKHGKKVYLVKRPHRFTAPGDPAVQEALDITFGSSVLDGADVAATRPDSAMVLDVTSWFVSDLAGVSRQARGAAGGSNPTVSLDGSRSYLAGASSFPENTNIQAKLTFGARQPGFLPSVPDGRYIPVTVHYTLAKLPERPMEPRMADDRIGSFLTVHKNFSTEDSTFFRRYVNRWRLERGERVGDRWRPVEPITYYIGPSVPEEYREWFKEGVENWNTAFEAAGWVDAVRALDLPEGADPNDIRYSVLRWNTSDRTGYGAIGPSKVDPRTGEILDADILFEAGMFLGVRNTWRDLVSPVTAAEAFEMALGVGDFEALNPGAPGVELPGFASALEAQGSLAGAVLAARGVIAPGEPVPDEVLGQFTKWVVMHEVGHTLGLQHNFRSSASTPLDRLHDTDFTGRNGVFSSVMEYPTVNVAGPGEENGHYYTFDAGSYDRWAISYAYTDDPDDAREIAREVAAPEHMFGTEAGGPGALDPTINVYDLSADPLGFGAERSALVRDLLERLPEYVLADNVEYAELTNAYGQLMSEYARALAPAVKYIGGQYMNRDHVGDGRLPFENVERSEQVEALELIVDRLFADGALSIDAETLQRLAPTHFQHWGLSRTFDGRYDYPFHQRILALQTSVLNQLLHPARLSRIRDGETKFGQDRVVTIPEVMGSLTDAVWSEVEGGSSVITADRRDLQRAHLDAMTRLLVDPPTGTPADARAVARWELSELADRIESARAGVDDAYTAAHLFESLARIEKALEASLDTEVG